MKPLPSDWQQRLQSLFWPTVVISLLALAIPQSDWPMVFTGLLLLLALLESWQLLGGSLLIVWMLVALAVQFVFALPLFAWLAWFFLLIALSLAGYSGQLLPLNKQQLQFCQAGILSGLFLAMALSPSAFLGALLTAVLMDTLAYLFGQCYGRHKLLPAVSPAKTFEGLLAGVFFSLIVLSWFGYPLGFVLLAIFGAFLGDLWLSFLKRLLKIKDSGCVLPGHGGILDRIDSWIGALFFVTLLR